MSGRTIRRKRKELELTLRQLAKLAGVTPAVVTLLENEDKIEDYRRRIQAALDAESARQDTEDT